jgi:hypothetical protein
MSRDWLIELFNLNFAISILRGASTKKLTDATMKSHRILSLVAVASVANAFQDTSPFFLFSTSVYVHLIILCRAHQTLTFYFRLPDTSELSSLNLASSHNVNSHLAQILSSCPSDAYIIVTQPGVSARDFGSGKATPHLRNALNGNGTEGPLKTTVVVSEVHGLVNTNSVIGILEDKCGARLVFADAASKDISHFHQYWARKKYELGC